MMTAYRPTEPCRKKLVWKDFLLEKFYSLSPIKKDSTIKDASRRISGSSLNQVAGNQQIR